MKLYISIPISGRDIEQVKKEIELARTAITEAGHEAVSPLDGVTDYTLPWIEYIITDLRTISECDGVCYVKASRFSAGCAIEGIVADKLNLHRFVFSPRSHQLKQIV